MPEAFDAQALRAAAKLAESGDCLLADALTRASAEGRVTQDLAGAPELLRRFKQALPAARALLEVAMDARRLGVGLYLPHEFLIDAAADYLTDIDYNDLADDWAEAAFADLARPAHGKQAPLRRANPRPARRSPGTPQSSRSTCAAPGTVFRLVDYLEHHGRTTRRALCPPSSFWDAAHTHLTNPDDLGHLAKAADNKHRLQWAHYLRQAAANAGSSQALGWLADLREDAGDQEGAETFAQQAVDAGDTSALLRLANFREKAGDLQEAQTLTQQAVDTGDASAIVLLVELREKAGDRAGAETLLRQAVEAGNPSALSLLARLKEKAGDREGAETLAQRAADAGKTSVLIDLVILRENSGDLRGAETLAQRAADAGATSVLSLLVALREISGNLRGAETLAQWAADAGIISLLLDLANFREKAGDRAGAESLAQRAADAGNGYSFFASTHTAHLHTLLRRLFPHGLDPGGTPTAPWS